MKIFTFLSTLLINVVSMAGHQGEIAILSGNGEAFYVMVNGTFRNYHPQSNVSMQLSTDQMHNVRVIGANNNFSLDQHLVAKPDRKMTYRIHRQYGMYQLVFVHETPLYNNGGSGFYPPNPYGNGCDGHPYPGSHPHGQPTGYPGNNGPGQYYGGYQAMTSAELDNLKRAVEHESFSDDKLRVAKAAAKSKYMRVSQIKEIARFFTFSDEKLEFTKAAYANCVDKSNYYEVMEVFTFSSDKRALQEFIDAQ